MSVFQPPIREITLSLRGESIPVCTRPGIPHWDALTPAAALLHEHLALQPGEHGLLMGCSPAALGVSLARQSAPAPLALAETSWLALELARQSFALNGLPAPLEESSLLPASLDRAAIELPKGRKLARRWLLQAHASLKPGGWLYLAGPNDEGIQAVIKDASELFGNASLLAYKKSNRVARLRKLENTAFPPWASEAGLAPGSWYTFDADLPGGRFRIHSLPGVFSFDRLDEATALLLEQVTIPAGGQVLDFGCGYGIIGLYAACHGAEAVDLVDVNLLAIAAARKNLEYHGLSNARVLGGDLLEPVSGQRYSLIVSNPPFHTGQEVDYATAQAFISQAYHLLEPQGHLIVVANRFIRYEREMQAIFGNARILAATGKFHLLESIRQTTRKESPPK